MSKSTGCHDFAACNSIEDVVRACPRKRLGFRECFCELNYQSPRANVEPAYQQSVIWHPARLIKNLR